VSGAGNDGLLGLLDWKNDKRKRHKMTRRLIKKRLANRIVHPILTWPRWDAPGTEFFRGEGQ